MRSAARWAFPTANLRLHDEKCVPALGIYAVWARIAGEGAWRWGAMSVGVRPDLRRPGADARGLPAGLLAGTSTGRTLEVEFVDWLRPELRFDGREALIGEPSTPTWP